MAKTGLNHRTEGTTTEIGGGVLPDVVHRAGLETIVGLL